MYFKSRLPAQELDCAPILLVLPPIKAEWLGGESQKMVSAVCSAHGMEGAEKSHRPHYFCMMPTYSERDYQEKK
jgi:hypothetical protein